MVASSWTLAVNPVDGSLDTQYPAGDKPDRPVDILPEPVKDLVATATGTSTIRLTWTPVIGATAYFLEASSDNINWTSSITVSGPPYDVLNLQSSTQYWMRAYSENANGRSAASNTATATTDAAAPVDPGDPIFYDDFERYSVGTRLASVVPPIAVSGAMWTYSRGDDPPYIVSGGHGGSSRCLGFDIRAHYDGSDNYSFSEQRFKLTNAGTASTIDEIWIEFYLYWPSNYDTLTNAQLDNQKTVLFWNEANGYWKGFGWGSEHWWGSSTRCIQLQNPRTSSANYGHGPDDWASPPYSASNYDGANHFNPTKNNSQSKSFWDKAQDNGNWRRYRWHARGDPGGGSSGLMEGWKDDVKISYMNNIVWGRGGTPGWDVGYLLGWWNLSVVQNVIIKMDKVAFYTSDPGW